MKLLTFILVLSSCLSAANKKYSYIDNREVITSKIKGIIITEDSYHPPDYVLKTTEGVLFYRVSGANDSSPQASFSKYLERRAIGKAITYSDIEIYKKEIADFYLNHRNSHVEVSLPIQDYSLGVIVLKVTETKVGEISVVGNKWFSKDHYLDYISLQSKDAVDSSRLVTSLDRINSSPWKKAEINFKEGVSSNLTDIELRVEDKKPVDLYAGADNAGVKVTGYSRVYTGFNWGSVFNTDQLIAFCYTSSPDFEVYRSFDINYRAPLSNGDGLSASGSYCRINAGEIDTLNTDDIGESWEISSRYDIGISKSLTATHQILLGVDYKSTNNDFNVGEETISPFYATVLQLAARYCGNITLGSNTFFVNLTTKVQPWKFGSISDQTYQSLREAATPIYGLARLNGGCCIHIGKTSPLIASFRVDGQISTSALIPIEQFGMGGVNSVRGYVEREVNVDDGFIWTFELESPKFSLIKYISHKNRHLDKLSATLFLDTGNGWLNDADGHHRKHYFLCGVGPGLKYDMAEAIFAKFDLGVKLTEVPGNVPLSSPVRGYFSLIGTY